jgi:hypothetical protein
MPPCSSAFANVDVSIILELFPPDEAFMGMREY